MEETTKVTYGNLLALPVGGDGLLYVQPMYTEAKSGNSAMPKLYRVLTYYNAAAGADNVNVGFAPTVAEALAQVGINPSAATPTDAGEGADDQDGTDDKDEPTPTPAPGGDDSGGRDRDAELKQMKDLVQQLEEAIAKFEQNGG